MCSEQTREFSQVADLQSAVVRLENMLSLYKEDAYKDYREVRRKNLDIENSVHNLKSLFQTGDSKSQESWHHNCGMRTSNELHGIFNRKKLLKMFRSYISELLTNSDEFQNSGIKQLIHHGVKKEMESYIPNLKPAPKHTNQGKGDFNRKMRVDSKDAPILINQRKELSTDDRKEFTTDSYRDNNVQSDGAYQNDMKRIYSILINQGTKVEEVTANLETKIKELDAQTRNTHSKLESTAQRFGKSSITSELKNVHNNISVIADAYHNVERKPRNITTGQVNYLIDVKVESMGDNIVDRLLHESSPLNNKIQDLEQNGRMLAENSTAEITKVRFELSTLINKMESLNSTVSTMTQSMPLLDKVKEFLQIVYDLKRSLPNLEDLRDSISNQTSQNLEQTKAILTLENKVKNLINNEIVVLNAIDNYDNRLSEISKDILNIEVREWTQYDFSHSNDRNGCHGSTNMLKKGQKCTINSM
ncbi:uncharacterized protein LOC128211484 [Mya arenaria]|uniref:uncharacterized protein LOC128211484 n=1 Tax=Mya arenaria TaxID=6604 RepID=UPI0022E45FD1|nr:uncharacterized protein LOC128211484 [Mya arenaria]